MFTVSGQAKLKDITNKLKNLKVPIHHALQTLSNEWVHDIQEAMYKTQRGDGGHSLPGNAPAVSSGKLVSSFRSKVFGWHTIEVGTDVDYASYLEHGTKKMEARPMLGDRYYKQELSNKFRDYIITEITKYIG